MSIQSKSVGTSHITTHPFYEANDIERCFLLIQHNIISVQMARDLHKRMVEGKGEDEVSESSYLNDVESEHSESLFLLGQASDMLNILTHKVAVEMKAIRFDQSIGDI